MTIELRVELCVSTGKNPYNCHECEKAFKNPNSLKNHRIKYHGYIPKKKSQRDRAAQGPAE